MQAVRSRHTRKYSTETTQMVDVKAVGGFKAAVRASGSASSSSPSVESDDLLGNSPRVETNSPLNKHFAV